MSETDSSTAPAPVRAFRVRTGIQCSPGSSSGDWKLYTDQAAMLQDLLVANLQLAKADGRHPDQHACRQWLQLLTGDPESYPRVKNIFHVEQLVDGAWVDLQVEFTPPAVRIGGVQ